MCDSCKCDSIREAECTLDKCKDIGTENECNCGECDDFCDCRCHWTEDDWRDYEAELRCDAYMEKYGSGG